MAGARVGDANNSLMIWNVHDGIAKERALSKMKGNFLLLRESRLPGVLSGFVQTCTVGGRELAQFKLALQQQKDGSYAWQVFNSSEYQNKILPQFVINRGDVFSSLIEQVDIVLAHLWQSFEGFKENIIFPPKECAAVSYMSYTTSRVSTAEPDFPLDRLASLTVDLVHPPERRVVPAAATHRAVNAALAAAPARPSGVPGKPVVAAAAPAAPAEVKAPSKQAGNYFYSLHPRKSEFALFDDICDDTWTKEICEKGKELRDLWIEPPRDRSPSPRAKRR